LKCGAGAGDLLEQIFEEAFKPNAMIIALGLMSI
jgi:hypothetical protein